MKLLLDTHAFLWWDADQTQLSSGAITACLDPANSISSVWELQIKMQLGELALRLSLANVLDEQRRNGLLIEPVTVEDILGLSDLPMIHRDPFDRLLVAQARRGDFQLIARYGVPILW